MGPIGSGIAGPGGPGALAGSLGQHLVDGARSVFGNEQVAQGLRDVVGGLKGGTPPIDPSFIDPAIGAPGMNAAPPGAPPSFRNGVGVDWDANAGRPGNYGRSAPNGARPWQPMEAGMPGDPLPGDPGAPGGGSMIKQGLGEIASGMATAARNGAIFSGLFSLAINGYKVFRGHEPISEAAGSVVADTADGAVSGAIGAAASGAAIFAATAAGLTVGLPLTILGVAAGFGGALLGDYLFKKTGLYGGIKNAVSRLFGGTAIGGAVGNQIPIGGSLGNQVPIGGTFGSSPVGGMVPVPGNLGNLIPLH